MKPVLKSLAPLACAISLTSGLWGCVPIASTYYDDSAPYYEDSPYPGHEHRREHLNREREKLRDERRRIEQERRRLEEEQRRREEAATRPPEPPRQTHCPAGYRPSEQKCTDKERKHGCKDVRLDSGLGCVHRP
jgi:hypothetical protein